MRFARLFAAFLALTTLAAMNAGAGQYSIAPTAPINVPAGSTIVPEFVLTNSGATFSGAITISLSVTTGGSFSGDTIIAPPVSGGCTNGVPARTCSGFNYTIPASGKVSIKQPITIATTAPSQVVYRVKIDLTPTGGSSFVAADESITINVTTGAQIVVSTFPTGMAQATGSGGGADNYVLTNIGQSPSAITLRQTGNFFTQSPAAFTLNPGQSQTVIIGGIAQSTQAIFSGKSIPSGNGVPEGLEIDIRMISANRPSALPEPKATSTRVDVGSDVGGPTQVAGSVTFTNNKSGTVRGVFTSDVPWLLPPTGMFQLGGGETRSVSFLVDNTLRPQGAELGSLNGALTLRYLLNGITSNSAREEILADPPGTASTSVAVTSTVAPATGPGVIPALGANEVAIYVPGVGHVQGSVGLFLSDVSVANIIRTGSISDIRMYYSALSGGTRTAAFGTVSPNLPALYADIVKTVFADAQVGSLQLRTADFDKIAVTANVFNSSNPAGTYGTAIPIFRSDRSAATGSRIYLTGLRKDAAGHTNIYIQETQGSGASLKIDFYDEGGRPIGSRNETVNPFALKQITDALPNGAVSAVISHASGSTGRVAAYATPVDRASGDTWAVADWPRQYAYASTQPVIVPVAGAAIGANSTYFRTDVAIMNRGSGGATGTLRFYGRNGEVIDRAVSLSSFETELLSDITTNLFALPEGRIGYLLYTPATGDVVITSRTYTTVSGQTATFGTAVPTLPLSYAIRAGQMRRIGGFEDASLSNVTTGRAGTFRTNFGLLEVAGQSATVRVTLRYTHPGQLAASSAAATREFPLAPRQFALTNNIANWVLGASRTNLGDLRNLQVDFEVISGSGQVIPFISSVDNGSGDSISRTE